MFIGTVLIGLTLKEAEELLKQEGRKYEVIITSKENLRLPRKKGLSYPKAESFRVIGQAQMGDVTRIWATEDLSEELLKGKVS